MHLIKSRLNVPAYKLQGNYSVEADTIRDIIVQPTFRFHNLENKRGRDLQGFFAIDVKSIREQWRIILQPLDENKKPYDTCYIDQISSYVRIVEITEVSKHYE